MKRDDHLALTAHLAGGYPALWKNHTLRRALLLGAVLPDSNPATYLRGLSLAGRPTGHNTEQAFPLILRLLTALRRTGVRNARQAYCLGALTHYLADAFTYPHTRGFHGGIRAHNRFERDLHRVFPDILRAAEGTEPAPDDPYRFLLSELAGNAQALHTPERDAARIVQICTAIWRSVFQENAQKSPISNKKS